MAEASKSRLSLDMDEIERQLRRSATQPAPSKSDPLAELARIVGQDDPFRALLAGERVSSHRPTAGDEIFARREPLFDNAHHGQNGHGSYQLRGSLPEETGHAQAYRDQPFALTAEEEAILHGQHGHHYADAHDPALYYDTTPNYAADEPAFAPPAQPRRSRKGLVAAGAVVAAAALASAGTWALRPGSPVSVDGQPPVVKAESGPLKIAPQNPGGIDIPNQNKKIYEPAAPDTQTRVVNREEQPIDIRQAMRSGGSPPDAAGSARLAPAPSQAGIAPNGPTPSLQTPNGSVTGLLGEPRRVRTLTIKPDGSIVSQDPSGSARPAPIPPPPTMVMPTDPPRPPAPAASPSQSSQALLPQRPRDVSPPSPAPRSPSSGETQARGPLQITPDAARINSDSRFAAAPPSASLREPTETSAAPTGSGYSVQLGVRTTEREARQAFDQFQQRYAGDLSGFSPLILQAEINGKTAYRVRVGPMSRDDATSLCTRLKTAGGQCFVANN